MSPIIPDDKNWTFVLDSTCSECGQDVRRTSPSDVVSELPSVVERYLAVLERPAARIRQREDRWSEQEYVVHVAEVFEVMTQRLELMMDLDAPTFPNWDQDAAAEAGKYNELEPQRAAEQLRTAADRFAATLWNIESSDYQRTGLRSNGSAFTIATLAQYAWHDVLHHLWDLDA